MVWFYWAIILLSSNTPLKLKMNPWIWNVFWMYNMINLEMQKRTSVIYGEWPQLITSWLTATIENCIHEWKYHIHRWTMLLVVARHMVHRMCLPSKGLRLIMVMGLCEKGMAILPCSTLTYPTPQKWWGKNGAIFCPRTPGRGKDGFTIFIPTLH